MEIFNVWANLRMGKILLLAHVPVPAHSTAV